MFWDFLYFWKLKMTFAPTSQPRPPPPPSSSLFLPESLLTLENPPSKRGDCFGTAMAVSTTLLMASKTLATNSAFSLLRRNPTPLSLCTLSEPTTLAFSSPSPPIPGQNPPNPTHSPPAGGTQTITTLVALALALSKLIASKISPLSLKLGAIHRNPNNNLSTEAVGLLFFASMSDGGAPQSMGTTIAAILERLARWVEIYICVLQIRVLLSLYPNIQWDKQPVSANRDLRDPFSSLFRGILPPSFNSSDVSTALAFLLLGMLRLFLTPPGSY